MSQTPAPAGSSPPAVGEAAFEKAVRDAQADLTASIEKGNLRNDPLRFPLAALAVTLGTFPELLHQMRAAAQDARQPLDAAAIDRMEQAAAQGASRASAALVKAHNRRSILTGSLSVAAAVAVALGGGYWWGRSAALTQFRLAETGFSQMMHDSPATAAGWLNLAQQNDYAQLMAVCHGERAFTDPSGRRACAAPLWLEPPRASAPPKDGAKPH